MNKSIFFYFPSNYYFSKVIFPYLFNYKNLIIYFKILFMFNYFFLIYFTKNKLPLV